MAGSENIFEWNRKVKDGQVQDADISNWKEKEVLGE